MFAVAGFWLLHTWYHIISTILGYGLRDGIYTTSIAIVRDAIWFLLVVWVAIRKYSYIISYLRRWRSLWAALLVTCIFSIVWSMYMDQWWYEILIGIKYGFMYLVIFASASLVGFLTLRTQSDKKIEYWMSIIVRIIWVITLIWLIWQGFKWFFPEFFLHIGYGPIGDFVFGANPPLYYRTGPWWLPRLQWLFAGPNNYGYFLLAFIPLVVVYARKKLSRPYLATVILVMTSTIMTLSRTAWIGLILAIVFLYRRKIVEYKYISLWLGLLIISAFIALSIIKSGSSLEHIQAKLMYIPTIIHQPLGYGLGSSWPAVHHNWQFLPENYYFQLLLDIGSIWFLFWTTIVASIWYILRRFIIRNSTYISVQTTRALVLGFFLLLVSGMFLHVFEDSMVNYLFFIIFGLWCWYHTSTYPSKKWDS